MDLFGYIRIDKSGLSEEEYELYRGVYCSLCRQLGKEYSVFARSILSFDCTFYALLILSLSRDCPSFTDGRCPFNPTKKCSYCEGEYQALSFASALSVSSAYFKLLDNISDSVWYKRCFYRMIKPFFSRWRKKSQRSYPFIDAAVDKMMSRQKKAEEDPLCSVDNAADPTGEMLSALFELIPDHFELIQHYEKETLKRILSSFGYFLGRWIYLMDAADDFQNDRKRGGFNPFLIAGYDDDSLVSAVLPMLNHALSEALLSYGLLDKCRYDAVISNSLYSACMKVQKSTLSKFEKQSSGEENEKSL